MRKNQKQYLGALPVGTKVRLPIGSSWFVIDHLSNDKEKKFVSGVILYKGDTVSWAHPEAASSVSVALSKDFDNRGLYNINEFTLNWAIVDDKFKKEYPFWINLMGDTKCIVEPKIVNPANVCKECKSPMLHTTRKTCKNCLILNSFLKDISPGQ